MKDGEGTEDVAKSMADYMPVVKKKIKRVWGIKQNRKEAVVGVLKKMIGKDKTAKRGQAIA